MPTDLSSTAGSAGANALERIGGLLGLAPPDIERGRGLLTLLGDPARRTVLETLSRRPRKPSDKLPELTGMQGPDIYHRLRSLRRGAVVVRNRYHVYSVDPAALRCASRYIDALAVVASLTARSGPR